MTNTGILSRLFSGEDLENIEQYSSLLTIPESFTTATPDNICFTVMTYFPLQFSRFALTSIRPSASPVRSSPPLETAIAPPLQPRTDRPHPRRSNSLARNAGDHLCPETRPCPRPSSGGKRRVRILAGTTDDRDGLLGNVDSQRRYAAHLNAQSNASCESFMKTLKREEIYANRYENLEHLRTNVEESSSSITTSSACTPRWATNLRSNSSSGTQL
jgi:hypothetical protein